MSAVGWSCDESLQLAKVREVTRATEYKWQFFTQSQCRIHRGFEPTTDLGIGNTRLEPPHEFWLVEIYNTRPLGNVFTRNNRVEVGRSRLAEV